VDGRESAINHDVGKGGVLMNHRKSYWIVSLVLFSLALLLCVIYAIGRRMGTPSPSDGSGQTTAELVAAVTERLTSIDSLYGDCEQQFSNSKNRTRFLYARSGDMWYYMEPTPDGRENTSCSDGNYEYTYLVRQPWENNKHWTGVQVHDLRKDRIFGPEGLLGTPYNLGRSVADVFKTATDVTKSAQGLPNGTTGFRLVAQGVASANPNARHRYTVAVTLDPIHDFLPCDVFVTTSESPNWSERWKVLEYRQLLDERTGKKIWFPVSGVLEWGTPKAPTMQMTLRDVRINSKLPSKLFRPEVPIGVTLTDCTSKGIDRAMAARLKLSIYRSPTLKEQIAAEFNQPGTLDARVDRAIRDARLRFQRVLIVLADPASNACQQLYPLYFDDGTAQKTFNDYLLLSANANAVNAGVLAAVLKAPLKTDQIGEKKPFLWVVEGNGTLLATADLQMISKGSQIDRQRLIDFLKTNAPVLPDAETVLADALANAGREDKCVLLEETGAHCGWCLVLGRFLEAHRKLLEQDYVLASIDRCRFRNGQQVMHRLRKSDGGIPWMAILDSNGKVRITSDGPNGLIGYPAKPESITYFLKMLTSTAPRLTAQQVATLRDDLENADAAKAATK
jgi:outer membrane lipoprotein-sorting protein